MESWRLRVAQAVEVEPTITQSLDAEIDEVFVVSEEEDLSASSQRPQLWQNRFCAVVVECDQQIIQYEGHGLMMLKMPLERRESQSKEQLIPGTIA